MRVWVLVIAACSTPAPKHDPVHTPPDDEDKSIAWQAAQPKPDAGSTWTFDWELIRKNYDKLMATPPGETPCDWRVRPRPNVECLPPGRPLWHAAKVKQVVRVDPGVTRVELDIGDGDKLTDAWWGAVIDDTGKPVTAWVHPENIALRRSFLTVSIESARVERKTRAALVKEKPEP